MAKKLVKEAIFTKMEIRISVDGKAIRKVDLVSIYMPVNDFLLGFLISCRI